MQQRRIVRIMVLLLFAATLLSAQSVERWLHTPPGRESQFMKSPIGAQKPVGVIVPIRYDGWARDVTRFCKSLALDMTPDAGYHQESMGPTLSEIKEIEDRLLAAAIQASDTLSAAPASNESASLLPATTTISDPYDMGSEQAPPRNEPVRKAYSADDPYR